MVQGYRVPRWSHALAGSSARQSTRSSRSSTTRAAPSSSTRTSNSRTRSALALAEADELVGELMVGAVMGDAAQDSGPVGQAFGRVADALRAQSLGPDVQLVFDFPGTVGGPMHAGMRVGRLGTGGAQVWIAVPESVNADSDPEGRILALAASALHAGLAGKVKRAEIDEVVAAAAGQLGRPTVEPEPLPVSGLPRTPTIVLRWATDDPRVIDELLRFESELDAALQADALGYVDGNEVGSGEFELYVRYTKGRKREVLRRIREMAEHQSLAPSIE